MKRHLTFIGACALIAAAIFFSVPNGHFSSLADIIEGARTPAISPTGMMINYNRPLHVERWDLS